MEETAKIRKSNEWDRTTARQKLVETERRREALAKHERQIFSRNHSALPPATIQEKREN